jgi:hypothetical protein
VPDPDRPLVGPGPDLRLLQRRAELRRGGDPVVAPDLPEQLVGLGVAVPLVLGGDLEQLALRGAVALADDQLQPAAGEVVQRGVVLVGADRVEQAQRGDRGEQPDPVGECGDMAEDDGGGG